jgi:hypothetical protein
MKPMKIKLEITMGNAAVQTWGEVVEAIKNTVERYSGSDCEPHDGESRKIYDGNGNVVGKLTVES